MESSFAEKSDAKLVSLAMYIQSQIGACNEISDACDSIAHFMSRTEQSSMSTCRFFFLV